MSLIYSPFFIFNFLIALYSYLLIPFFVTLKSLDFHSYNVILYYGISCNCFFSFGYFIASSLSNKRYISHAASFPYSKKFTLKFEIIFFVFITIYSVVLMCLAAGDVYDFLFNLDKRQIYMAGITSLTAPIFICKYICFFRYIVCGKFDKVNICYVFLSVVVLGVFGRFFSMLFLLQFFYIYIYYECLRKNKKLNLIFFLFFCFLSFFIIFVYGGYRYYQGFSASHPNVGTFYDFIVGANFKQILSILILNFFDGVDVFYKTIQAVNLYGYTYGLSFFTSFFKFIPKLGTDSNYYFLADFLSVLRNVGIGHQAVGFLPETFYNFGVFGVLPFFLLGVTVRYLWSIFDSNSFLQTVISVIIITNMVQLIRNGTGPFVSFLFVDLVALFFVLFLFRISQFIIYNNRCN